MKPNPNPFTPLQEKFLNEVRSKLLEIRNPSKEIENNRSYEFYIEHTKTYGDIVKLRFRPNALTIKEEIMREVGYRPYAQKDTWQQARNAAASAFDKHWDNIIFRVIKGGRLLARINELFTAKSQPVAELIALVQECVAPITTNKITQEIPNKEVPSNDTDTNPAKPTYAEQLKTLAD